MTPNLSTKSHRAVATSAKALALGVPAFAGTTAWFAAAIRPAFDGTTALFAAPSK